MHMRTITAISALLVTTLAGCAGDDGTSATAGDTSTSDGTTTGGATTGASTTGGSGATTSAGSGGETETSATTAVDPTEGDAPVFQLTILHNSDGESQLLHAGKGLEDFGGAARFVTQVQALRAAATPEDTAERAYGAITLSSGDNFLAGPEFAASLKKGAPYYDAMVISAIGYDAICLGNHDFDFGPETLATFIGGVAGDGPFLSANLDVSKEPSLQALAMDGRIARSTVVTIGSRKVGVIGATTPMLPVISSPRDVEVDVMVADAIQVEVGSLEDQGIDTIILIAHLQSVDEDLALAPLLAGVDVMIAGGGDEVLADDGDLLIPGDEAEIYGPYPLIAENGVPVVTTKGGYRYVGQLIVDFDDKGEVTAIHDESRMVRVAGGDHEDAAAADPQVTATVLEPLSMALAELAANVIATSEVALDGKKASVRTKETNQGDLIADALLWQATALADKYGAPKPHIAVQNGGGIRNDTVIAAGDVSELDTFDMVPFPNFVTVVEDVSPAQLKELLENAVSKVEAADGRFAQIAGFRFIYDPTAKPRLLDAMGNKIQDGERVIDVTLGEDTALIQAGAPVPGAPNVHVATINFLAQGGDQYPFGGAAFTTLGVTYQQAVYNFIVDGLGGVIEAKWYPEAGLGRVVRKE